MSEANRFAQSRDLVFPVITPMRDEYIQYVYMMQSPSRRALYIGMTNNFRKRVWQRKKHAFAGFTDDYNCTRLVYQESFDDVANEIDRENHLKRWRREKKSSERTQRGRIGRRRVPPEKRKVPRLRSG